MTNQSAVLINDTYLRKHVDHDAFHASTTWWHAGALIGLGGGVLAATIGLILTAVTFFAGNETASDTVNWLGTALICSTIPAMIFGAHCLDKIEAVTKAKRLENCKQHGYTDEQCAHLDGK